MNGFKRWWKQAVQAEGATELTALDKLTRSAAVDLSRRKILKKLPLGAVVIGLGLAAAPSASAHINCEAIDSCVAVGTCSDGRTKFVTRYRCSDGHTFTSSAYSCGLC